MATGNAQDARAFIRDAALGVGFDAVGFAQASQSKIAVEGLLRFLEQGFHGDMGWLRERSDERSSPTRLWPEARSAVVLGHSYAPAHDPLAVLDTPERAAISVYAQGKDYHDVIKPRLKQVARQMVAKLGGDVKVFVDTAPVMEKPMGQAAGLGWQGKHTNLVSRTHGSWLFLGVILTTLDLQAHEPESDHCGSCSRCIDVCPTNAFIEPYRLDARRCISYLTIEHKGFISRELRPLMGNRIYGCDDCLAVCPWNKFASSTKETAYAARPSLRDAKLVDLLSLDDAAFRTMFSGSPIKRIGRDRFVRNVLIAAGNAALSSLVPKVEALLKDPSPVVRGTAAWALSRLVPAGDFARHREIAMASEVDEDVRAEWAAASGRS